MSLLVLIKPVRLASLILSIMVVFPALAIVNIHSIKAATLPIKETFSVLVTLYGVKSTTMDILTSITVGNSTKFILSDASKLDKTDKFPNDGIIDIGFAFMNETVPVGAEFKACSLVIKDMDPVCKTGHNSPDNRAEYSDLSLYPTKG